MGSEPEPTHTSLETLQEALQTERITYVDTLNEDIGAVVESADQLAFDCVVGDVSDYGTSSNDHVHFDLIHEGSTIHCVLFGYKRSTIDTTTFPFWPSTIKVDEDVGTGEVPVAGEAGEFHPREDFQRWSPGSRGTRTAPRTASQSQ